ncbi:hypothetical protein [Aquimarina sp. 2201CG14-23]|uniref:hypothetical protein n=1 Tax=Aquimarina mycalae TaxID=3040073 RepID=UPI002477F81E|nr:hypothetical protein [Aquimarina sp. 2201CG14-23]
MNQMKMNLETSNEDKSNSLTVIVEAFIPLFFEENTIHIKNNTFFLYKYKQHWKPNYLHLENVTDNIDHPPEIYFS